MNVLAFDDEIEPAARLARALGVALGVVDQHRFPDGEALVTVPPQQPTAILYRSLDWPDSKIMPLLLAADAARRAGARRVVLACPYLAYLRQDAVFKPGQPISRDVICTLLGGAFERVVTVDAHLHRTRDLSAAMGIPADDLSAAGPLAEALANGEAPVIVGPDRESAPWARRIAERLGGEALLLTKTRQGDDSVQLAAPDLAAVRGRRAVIVDDVVSTGATLLAVAGALRQAGAAKIEAAVVPALYDPALDPALRAAGIVRIVATDSAPHPASIVPLAPLLAQALRSEVP